MPNKNSSAASASGQQDSPLETMLTIEDVAGLLQVSTTWVIRSDLPFHKLGRLRR